MSGHKSYRITVHWFALGLAPGALCGDLETVYSVTTDSPEDVDKAAWRLACLHGVSCEPPHVVVSEVTQ